MRAFLVLLCVAAASAIAPLLKTEDAIPGQYIIVLKDGVALDAVISKLPGAQIKHRYTIVNGFAANLDPQLVEKVRALDSVEYVEEDGVARTQCASWGLDRVNQRTLPLDGDCNFSGNGGGTHIYVIDTGIRHTHNDFGSRAETAYSTLPDWSDCNGHGTHCSGTAAGNQYGVAKAANVYGVKVLNCQGSGTWSDIISGTDWVRLHANKPAVASMSLGGGKTTAVNAAVDNLVNSGIPTAVAAGNDNRDACNYSPASADKAITVGSTDDNDARSSFSNHGNCVDIFAPGRGITSAWHTSNSAFHTISGTSMATPHVAGGVAVLESEAAMYAAATSGVVGGNLFGAANLMLYVG